MSLVAGTAWAVVAVHLSAPGGHTPGAARPPVWSVTAAADVGRYLAARPGTARGPPPRWGVCPAPVQPRWPMAPRWGDQAVAQVIAVIDCGAGERPRRNPSAPARGAPLSSCVGHVCGGCGWPAHQSHRSGSGLASTAGRNVMCMSVTGDSPGDWRPDHVTHCCGV